MCPFADNALKTIKLSYDEELLEIAREEIRMSWRETCEINKGVEGFDPDKLPTFHDPFAGCGQFPEKFKGLALNP